MREAESWTTRSACGPSGCRRRRQRASADAYIAEKAAEFGIDLTEVNGSASSSAAVAETAEAAVAETAVAETESAEAESAVVAVVAVVAKTAVAAVVASTSAPTSATAGLSKRWRDVVQGRERPVVRPLAAVQITQSLHFLLRVASARSARVNTPGFLTAVFARQAQLKVSGKSRGAMIAANGPAAAKACAGAPSRRRKDFDVAAAAANALSADPPVPQTASGSSTSRAGKDEAAARERGRWAWR